MTILQSNMTSYLTAAAAAAQARAFLLSLVSFFFFGDPSYQVDEDPGDQFADPGVHIDPDNQDVDPGYQLAVPDCFVVSDYQNEVPSGGFDPRSGGFEPRIRPIRRRALSSPVSIDRRADRVRVFAHRLCLSTGELCHRPCLSTGEPTEGLGVPRYRLCLSTGGGL